MSLAQNLQIPDETATLLGHYGFDKGAFDRLRNLLKNGQFPASRNRIHATVEPPESGDLTAWADEGSDTEKHWVQLGRAALEKGEVAVAILNGGMATRFGGTVKGIVEVLPGRSFLDLRLSNISRTSPKAPVLLMNSFATHSKTRDHLAERDHFGLAGELIHMVNQRISLRLAPGGELFRDAKGNPIPYAPGHGDVFEVLAASEGLTQFRKHGGRYVMVGNVDNLAATLSPKVVGAHIAGGRPATVEVAPRNPGDKGGAPVRIDGRLAILEGFRFPGDFDHDRLPVFNTNTFLFNVDAIKGDYPLTWFRADKEVGGDKIVQFERLMGEVTSFIETTYLEVPREGPEGRFMPVKTPADLDVIRPQVVERNL